MLQNNVVDFNIVNGHARLSQRKVGELLGIVHSTVQKRLEDGSLFSTFEATTIKQQGFDGLSLSKLIIYYAFDSRQASDETKKRCRDMIIKASAKGFQDFLDAMAGVQTKTVQPYSEEAIQNEFRNLISLSAHNYIFEMPVARESSHIRFDFIDLNCKRLHRIYELKAGQITAEHIKEKLFTKQYINYFAKDADAQKRIKVGSPTVFDKRTIEFNFTSNVGIDSQALEYLLSLTDKKGNLLSEYVESILGSDNPLRKVRLFYVPLKHIYQPIVNELYDNYKLKGGVTADYVLDKMKPPFFESNYFNKPTALTIT